MNMIWYPVRCCCTPRKIFGFIRLPANAGHIYRVTDRRGTVHELELRPITTDHRYVLDADADCYSSELAIYSDDRPLEFWRMLPGFVEASCERR